MGFGWMDGFWILDGSMNRLINELQIASENRRIKKLDENRRTTDMTIIAHNLGLRIAHKLGLTIICKYENSTRK